MVESLWLSDEELLDCHTHYLPNPFMLDCTLKSANIAMSSISHRTFAAA